MGRAWATWSTIESLMGDHFRFLLGTDDFQAADVVFSTMGFRQKKKVINDLMLHHLARTPDPELLEHWERILGNLEDQYKSRNRLAHGQYVSVVDTKHSEIHKPMIVKSLSDRRFLDYGKKHIQGKFKGSLNENAVAGFVRNFSKTVSLLMKFQIVLIRYLSETGKFPSENPTPKPTPGGPK